MNKSCLKPTLGLLLLSLLLFFSTPLLALEDYILPSGEWRQISLPLDPGNTNNTVRAIFEDDIKAVKADAVYETDWIIFAYNSATGGYDLKKLGDVLQQGVGYWITQVTESTATLTMPEDSVAGPNSFSIPIIPPEEGASVRWNMLGHPFVEPVNLSDYRIKTSSGSCKGQGCDLTQAKEETILHNEIWRYVGGTYQKISGDTALSAWDGFWCVALTQSTGKNPQLFVASARHHPPIAGNWNLTFEEEFNGNSLDPNKWRVGHHYLGIAGNAGNSADQISVGGGSVKLTAKKQSIQFGDKWGKLNSFDYVSGEISTFQQFHQLYGYFEARIKYDVKQGVWPAFWTMPDLGDPKQDIYGNKSFAHESYMRFDLGSVPEAVTSAELSVVVSDFIPDPYAHNNQLVDITVHKLLDDDHDWTESGITWNNKPNYDPVWLHQFIQTIPERFKPAAQASSSESISQEEDPGYTAAEYNQAQLDSNKGTLYPRDPSMQEIAGVSSSESVEGATEIKPGDVLVFDVTAYIKSQIATGQKTAELALVDTFMRVHEISFWSKEAADPANQPKLVINGNEGASLVPSADASVNAGKNANTNYGTQATLTVRDPWKRTSSTKNKHGKGMEIDIMESLGNWGGDTQHAVHWNGYDRNNGYHHDQSSRVTLAPSTDGFHTYGMSWQPGRIDFYTDGIKSGWEFVNDRTGDIASYILLSHQLGGWEAGNAIPAGFQPATMSVDYVRAWSGSPSM